MLSETQKIAAEVKSLRGDKTQFHAPKNLRLKIVALTKDQKLSVVSDAVGVSGKTIYKWPEYQQQRLQKKSTKKFSEKKSGKRPEFTVTQITSKPPAEEYVTLKRADGIVLSVPAHSPLCEKMIASFLGAL
jgi:type IV secretory pathway TraG/TraD family ATPase VirD4